MKMKRSGALIISTAVAATMIAGCGKTMTETDPTIAPSDTTAQATTSAPAESSAAPSQPEGPQSFEELYANQLITYLDHQYYFDGVAIPTTESNFYFINAFLDLSNYASMGYYPSTNLGYIDLAAEYTGEEYGTYGDYFVKYAENSIESTCILCARAEAEGVTLPEETQTAIDGMMENIRTGSAANVGMTLDEYLQFYYGPGNDETTFRKVLERYYLADEYSKIYCENYEFSDEEKNVPYVRYALFYAPDSAEQATKDQALADATAMKDSCKTIDDLTGLAATAQENGIVYDQGDIAVPRGRMVPKFEEWAYEDGRTEGELDIIYAPEYGYFVVGYLGLQEQAADVLNQIALKELSDSILAEVDEDIHDFHTDDVFLPAPEGPTATPVPDNILPSDSGASFDSNATVNPAAVPSGDTQQNGNMSTTDVLIIVFFTLAGVAIVAVIGILIYSATKNKNGSSASSKPSKKVYDDDEDEADDDFEDEEEVVKPAKSGKNKKSEPEEEAEDEEEEGGDEDKDEDED